VIRNSNIFSVFRLASCVHFFLAQAVEEIEMLEDAMTIRKHTSLAAAMMMAAFFAVQAMAQNSTQSATQETAVKSGAAEQETPVAPQRVIVVSLEDRKLALIENGKVVKTYTVAVGKPTTPSPVGTFSIERRVMNPTYSHDGRIVAPGPNNPVGTRWMGLNVRGYGIHGTNAPNSIGKAASHGCIRMAKDDLEELYALVKAGDTVKLIGQRNEETAELFGDNAKPAVARQAAVQAAATQTTAPAAAVQSVTTGSAATVVVSASSTSAAGSL
jgi:lipoprotein-anchoring transpeptidase ErfK/SrfK